MVKSRSKRLAAAASTAAAAAQRNPKALRKLKISQAAKKGELVKVAKVRKIRKHESRKAQKRRVLNEVDWDEPAPGHLVARLDIPQIKSKYQSYFEFAENAEKQEKKLEFQVTNQVDPPPGYAFVPIGDPELTQKCKELSRQLDAMIFIVSNKGAEGARISQHIYRTGYHFRETIVEEARDFLGETVISKPNAVPGFIEPIPESQEEINKQADRGLRDLFPRIPNTDRQMIIEHAFQRGKLFHGEPTVGLQPDISLSRRIQLAVLAHIRHVHTRYDMLLRETTWINARKAVEPVCLDVLVKWRGDEETGRDQLDEILREVVIITDSEGEEDDDMTDDEEDDETSDDDDDGETTSISSPEPATNKVSRSQDRPGVRFASAGPSGPAPARVQVNQDSVPISARTRASSKSLEDRKRQRGFSRYQAAYENAMDRRQGQAPAAAPTYSAGTVAHPPSGMHAQIMQAFNNNQGNTHASSSRNYGQHEEARHAPAPVYATRPETFYVQSRSPPHGNQVISRAQPVQSSYHSYIRPRAATPPFLVRERPSQVVRGSPVGQNPQDMPLPSIENSSTFALPRPRVSGNMHVGSGSTQDDIPRPVEQRLQSPSQRQVIVIDDSPEVKRRRVVREDGHLSHGQNFLVAAPSRSSYLVSQSSAETGNFSHRMVESQATQGMSRPRQRVYIDPVTSEELPIFDEPSIRSYAPRQPAPGRPLDTGHAQENRHSHIVSHAPSAYAYDGRRVDAQPIYTQHARALPVEAVRADEYRALPQPPQYNDMHQNTVRIDRDLAHSLSQSRLDGPPPAANHDFIVLSERGVRVDPNRSNHVQYHENRSRPVQYAAYTRARSPAGHAQRPVVHLDDHRLPEQAYARNDAALQYQQPLPPGRATYVRSAEARRQVIVLD